jgi:hypothetical protein
MRLNDLTERRALAVAEMPLLLRKLPERLWIRTGIRTPVTAVKDDSRQAAMERRATDCS